MDKQPRWRRQAVLVIGDLIAVPICLSLAYLLRFGDFSALLRVEPWLLLSLPIVSIPAFYMVGLYRSLIRHIGPQAITAAVRGAFISALLLIALAILGNERDLPRSVPFIYWMAIFIAVGAPRFLARSFILRITQRRGVREPVIIYGAGAAGIQLVSALQQGLEYSIVAFVDDDLGLQGAQIRGVNVYSPQELPRLIGKHDAKQILIAMPSVSPERRRDIMQELGDLPVRVKTLPTLGDLVSGKSRLDELREVRIEDILGREPVPPQQELLERNIRGKVVLVTGAGGSIGSELCRQIALLGPTRLIGLDLSELAIYQLDQEMRRLALIEGLEVPFYPIIGSVLDRNKMAAIMQGHGVQTLYHAAAYKHVPLVESNAIEGLRNNVFGTQVCATAAQEAGVELFVLISTDKAVRPTNVMGASKRLSEMLLQNLQRNEGGTRFVMVRFGNVLGSSGSVVPLFQDQIIKGGPVTVTHPEITRYFMTLSEAGELVIQAGSMGAGGEVFLLDMGAPVKIEGLARRMIHLMGYDVREADNPDGEIDILHTGLRPGEKLFEELLIGGDTLPTAHPRILCAQEDAPDAAATELALQQLGAAIGRADINAVRAVLSDAIPGYRPSGKESDFLEGFAGASLDSDLSAS